MLICAENSHILSIKIVSDEVNRIWVNIPQDSMEFRELLSKVSTFQKA